MIVGLLVGLSISDSSAFTLEIGLPIGGTVRSTELVQLQTRGTFLEFTRSLISDMYTSMPFSTGGKTAKIMTNITWAIGAFQSTIT